MLIDNKIISGLANQALEQSQQKNEVKAFLVQKAEKSIQYWEDNNNESAILTIKSAIDIAPNLAFLKILKALFHCSSKKAKTSNALISSIRTTDLSDLELNMIDFIRSCNSLHLEQYSDTIKYSSKIIDQNPQSYFAYLPRAVAYQELDNQSAAISDFKMALKEQIQVKGVKAGLAFSYMKKRRFIKALFLHLGIIKHFENNYRVNHNIGTNYFMLSMHKRALKHMNRAIELKEDFADAYRSRGLIYLDEGKIEMAKKELNLAKRYGAKNIDKTIKRFEKRLNKYET